MADYVISSRIMHKALPREMLTRLSEEDWEDLIERQSFGRKIECCDSVGILNDRLQIVVISWLGHRCTRTVLMMDVKYYNL